MLNACKLYGQNMHSADDVHICGTNSGGLGWADRQHPQNLEQVRPSESASRAVRSLTSLVNSVL